MFPQFILNRKHVPKRGVYHNANQLFKTICGDAPEGLKKVFEHLKFIQDCYHHQMFNFIH